MCGGLKICLLVAVFFCSLGAFQAGRIPDRILKTRESTTKEAGPRGKGDRNVGHGSITDTEHPAAPVSESIADTLREHQVFHANQNKGRDELNEEEEREDPSLPEEVQQNGEEEGSSENIPAKEEDEEKDLPPEVSFKGGSGYRSYGSSHSYHYVSHSSSSGDFDAFWLLFLLVILLCWIPDLCCPDREETTITTVQVANPSLPNSMVHTETVNPADRAMYEAFGSQSEHWVREQGIAATATWGMSQGVSGPWKGTYTEEGESHDCFYNLDVTPVPDVMGLQDVTGRHGDSDGGGWLRGKVNLSAGRLIWTEHYEGTSLQVAVRGTFVNPHTITFEAVAVNGVRMFGSIIKEAAGGITTDVHASAPGTGLPTTNPYAQPSPYAHPGASPYSTPGDVHATAPGAYTSGVYPQPGLAPPTQPAPLSGQAPPPFMPASQAASALPAPFGS
uniref:F5/8 type C domain-containing protein n=1 Tax=Chromera velia CCMP2878 TaxID=1169474 RepID=A0A0G4I578_9ALVE|eukprot:Cvel_11074.t1-p1 / transcript=Cvel_11074.t1 / gene=Cvel_11074 / organism=Chromera_velia_CCMP2878 / gene_product=hypothetical protein / transcript_product=hypothetical protein / location=Cvel_scaffold684:20779-22561(-) / protein_length=446 / sequence_SO=supercontig / SO=protein_coding / is_pseudo=false